MPSEEIPSHLPSKLCYPVRYWVRNRSQNKSYKQNKTWRNQMYDYKGRGRRRETYRDNDRVRDRQRQSSKFNLTTVTLVLIYICLYFQENGKKRSKYVLIQAIAF